MMEQASQSSDRPLRVCLVVPYDLRPEGGGVKQHAIHLAGALSRLGDNVTIVGPASGRMRTPGFCGFRGVVSIRANGSDNKLGLFVSPQKIWRFFRERVFDVIHLHEPQTPMLPYWVSWASHRVAQVATFHAYAESNAALLARQMGGAVIFSRVQRAIAVSAPAARYASGSWKRPLTIIPNGVSLKIFRPSTDLPKQDRPVRLLFVGRLADERKGARLVLDAFARLVQRGIHATLDMVGDLEDFGELPNYAGLRFHGEVGMEALVDAYRRCDVFVAPSTGQESFGIILLEAMASGKAVVCSDIEGYRGTVHPRGAELVPPNDVMALTRALEDIVKLGPAGRQAMGIANLQHVQGFDWDVLAERIRHEYIAAIGENNAALR